MKSNIVASGILAAAMLTSVNASAQNWFVSATVGESDFDTGFPSGGGFSRDEDDTALGINFGYNFVEYFGVEVGYQDLGEASVKTTTSFTESLYGSTVTLGAGSKLEQDTTGWNLGVIGTIPINNWFDIHGRLGMFWWESELTYSGTVTIDGVSYSGSFDEDEDGTDFYIGMGATFNFTDYLGLGLEAVRYELEDDYDVDVFNARLIFSF